MGIIADCLPSWTSDPSCHAAKSATATVFQVAKSNAPFLIVHGTAGTTASIAQAQELHYKLQQAVVPATLVKVDDDQTFATREARRRLAFESLKFFERYLIVNP